MNKLRLAHVLPTLPRYKNTINKGNYKNGNYKGVTIVIPFKGLNNLCVKEYDANNIPIELFEKPWYVSELMPYVRSAHGNKGNAGLKIILNKEEN